MSYGNLCNLNARPKFNSQGNTELIILCYVNKVHAMFLQITHCYSNLTSDIYIRETIQHAHINNSRHQKTY